MEHQLKHSWLNQVVHRYICNCRSNWTMFLISSFRYGRYSLQIISFWFWHWLCVFQGMHRSFDWPKYMEMCDIFWLFIAIIWSKSFMQNQIRCCNLVIHLKISTSGNDTVGHLKSFKIHPTYFTQIVVYVAMHIVVYYLEH